MSESFAELFEQSQIENKMRPGSIISAKVLDIKSDTVIVNAGLKSEGIIPIDQFYDVSGELEITIGTFSAPTLEHPSVDRFTYDTDLESS